MTSLAVSSSNVAPGGVLDRAREMIECFGAKRVADAAGVSQETVRRILSLGHTPPVRVALALCSEFGVNGDWLLLGEGPRMSRDLPREAMLRAAPEEILAALTHKCGETVRTFEVVERAAAADRKRTPPPGELRALAVHLGQIGGFLRTVAQMATPPQPPASLPFPASRPAARF